MLLTSVFGQDKTMFNCTKNHAALASAISEIWMGPPKFTKCHVT